MRKNSFFTHTSVSCFGTTKKCVIYNESADIAYNPETNFDVGGTLSASHIRSLAQSYSESNGLKTTLNPVVAPKLKVLDSFAA